jgi:hypothetical protein
MHELFSEELRVFNAVRDSGTLSAFRGTGMLRRETRPELEVEAGEGEEETEDDGFASTDPAVDADGVRLTVPLRARDGVQRAASAANELTAPTMVVGTVPAPIGVLPSTWFDAASVPTPAARPRRGLLVGGVVLAAVLLTVAGGLALRGRRAASPLPPAAVPVALTPAPASASMASPASAPASAPAAVAATPPAAGLRPRASRAAPRDAKARAADAKTTRGRKKAPPAGVNLDTALPP